MTYDVVNAKMSKKTNRSTSEQPPIIAEGMTLGVVGAGVMGQTLIRGLLASGLIPRERLWAGDKNSATCESASEALGIPVRADFQACVPTADMILACVKPLDAAAVMATLVQAGKLKHISAAA